MTNSADPPDAGAGNGGGSRRGWMIAIVAVAGVVLAVTSSGDSSNDDLATVDSASDTTEATDTTEGSAAPDTSPSLETTEAPASTDVPVDADLEFMVNDIDDGGTIPKKFTCDGADDVPIVSVTAAPEGTQQLALIMDDADAPTPDPFVHWVVYDIAAPSK